MKEESKRVLWKIYKAYYKLGIHYFIGNSGHAIFTGLLYKFNELGYPDELKISIQEMFALSAISDIRTLRNARNKLSAYLHEEGNPDSWIAKYHENGIKEYGTYQINFVYLQEFYSNFTEDLQESSSNKNKLSPKIEGDLLSKSAKNVLPSNTILEKNIQEKEEEVPDRVQSTKIIHDSEENKEPPPPPVSNLDRESFQIAKKAIEFNFDINYFTSRKGLMPAKRQAMVEIGKYPENLIKSAIEKKGNGIKNPEYLISNVLEELKANGNGHKPGNIKLLSDGVSKAEVEEYKVRTKAGHSRDTKDVLKAMQALCNGYSETPESVWTVYASRLNGDYTYEQFIEGVKDEMLGKERRG